jgi:hypothetical protein
MVRTMPPPSAAKSLWRIPALGWLVPLTVAATALVIWVAVPRRAPLQQSDAAATAVDQAPPALQSAPPADTLASTPPPAGLRERQDAAALDKEASPAPAAPAAESGARRDSTVAAARLSTFATALDSVIVSSNPATRFRLIPGGGVQRSADGGSTWRTEITGATETLTAGASPSPSVCWLIGPSGMVLLSTDGRPWRRLAFPEAVDLRSVSATDNESATVTTTDGRAFTTTDGGQTWSRAPGF